MKDRLTVLGVVALLVAIAATGWQLSTRGSSTVNPSAAVLVDATPGAVPAASPTPTLRRGPATETFVVHLDGVPGANAFAVPGDHVVLYAFFAADSNAGHAQTRLLLPDVPVVASGPADSAEASISVAVSAADAVFLRTVQGLGARTFAVLRPVAATFTDDPLAGVSDADVRQRLRPAS